MRMRSKIPVLLSISILSLTLMLAGQLPAQTYTTLHSFTATSGGSDTNSDGAHPSCGLVLSAATLYGTTSCGGSSGNGTVFRINRDGTGFTNLYDFTALTNTTNSDGTHPYAGLVLSGNTLYGTANEGGTSGAGTIFKLNTDGTDFTTLHHFSPQVDGAHPQAGLILSGSTLYGVAAEGGSSASGTVFRVNTDGTAFTNLYSFTGSNGTNTDGANPYAELILSKSTLYGTALNGGASGEGTVYKVNTDGTSFMTLHSFGSIFVESGRPMAGLILSANTLYGTASDTLYYPYGSVFAVNTDGTGFSALHNFTGIDGANPWAGLTLSGDTLYGTTTEPAELHGTVFAVNRGGSDFTTLHQFTGCFVAGCSTDGAVPLAPVILASNILYGTTFQGGSLGYGTVFSLVIMPRLKANAAGQYVVLTWPTNFTGFTLQSTTNLAAPAVWDTVSPGPAIVNGQNAVTNFISGPRQFYRLIQ